MEKRNQTRQHNIGVPSDSASGAGGEIIGTTEGNNNATLMEKIWREVYDMSQRVDTMKKQNDNRTREITKLLSDVLTEVEVLKGIHASSSRRPPMFGSTSSPTPKRRMSGTDSLGNAKKARKLPLYDIFTSTALRMSDRFIRYHIMCVVLSFSLHCPDAIAWMDHNTLPVIKRAFPNSVNTSPMAILFWTRLGFVQSGDFQDALSRSCSQIWRRYFVERIVSAQKMAVQYIGAYGAAEASDKPEWLMSFGETTSEIAKNVNVLFDYVEKDCKQRNSGNGRGRGVKRQRVDIERTALEEEKKQLENDLLSNRMAAVLSARSAFHKCMDDGINNARYVSYDKLWCFIDCANEDTSALPVEELEHFYIIIPSLPDVPKTKPGGGCMCR